MQPSRAALWDRSPVALLLLDSDGRILDANRELLRHVGARVRDDVRGRRLSDLLTVGGRIYWETHLAPLLRMEGRLDEVAVELRTPTGREPVLLTVAHRTAVDGTTDAVLLGTRERARFERELVEARTTAETAEHRVRALQRTAAALAGAAGAEGVVRVLLQSATTELGAEEAAMWTVAENGRLRHAGGRGGLVVPVAHELAGTVTRADGDVVVPLRQGGTLLGVLVLRPSRAPGATPVDAETLTAAGQQGALALARARTHERSLSVASVLQQAMLSGLTRDPRVEVVAEYRPGVHELEVGGDWYDTFLVADDRLALSVGDVVGRGLLAATAMGQLRTAARASAGPGVGPEGVLARLDDFVGRTGTGFMASVVYAELELVSGVLRYSCAGHLPPLHVRADGGAAYLWHARSTPLGVRGAAARTADTLRLARGDTVLLYTDGVVERRDRALPEGLDELAAAASRALTGRAPVDGLPARLVAAAAEHDDACVLALRWRG
jgi:hypothetical protein